jgi:hypothetical protein
MMKNHILLFKLPGNQQPKNVLPINNNTLPKFRFILAKRGKALSSRPFSRELKHAKGSSAAYSFVFPKVIS